jgi:hypothetical protein
MVVSIGSAGVGLDTMVGINVGVGTRVGVGGSVAVGGNAGGASVAGTLVAGAFVGGALVGRAMVAAGAAVGAPRLIVTALHASTSTAMAEIEMKTCGFIMISWVKKAPFECN